MKKQLFYFGCYRDKGHFPYMEYGGRLLEQYIKIPEANVRIIMHADAMFTPPPYKSGYRESMVPPFIIVSWWDTSLDHRPGSNSTFFGYGYNNADEIFEDAIKLFPEVMNRQERPKPFKVNI